MPEVEVIALDVECAFLTLAETVEGLAILCLPELLHMEGLLTLDLGGGEAMASGRLRQERAARVVVDQLGVDVVQAAEHRQPRPRRGSADEPPQPLMPDVARRPPFLGDHFAPAPAFLPTFFRTTSSEYLMPLPL